MSCLFILLGFFNLFLWDFQCFKSFWLWYNSRWNEDDQLHGITLFFKLLARKSWGSCVWKDLLRDFFFCKLNQCWITFLMKTLMYRKEIWSKCKQNVHIKVIFITLQYRHYLYKACISFSGKVFLLYQS